MEEKINIKRKKTKLFTKSNIICIIALLTVPLIILIYGFIDSSIYQNKATPYTFYAIIALFVVVLICSILWHIIIKNKKWNNANLDLSPLEIKNENFVIHNSEVERVVPIKDIKNVKLDEMSKDSLYLMLDETRAIPIFNIENVEDAINQIEIIISDKLNKKE